MDKREIGKFCLVYYIFVCFWGNKRNHLEDKTNMVHKKNEKQE